MIQPQEPLNCLRCKGARFAMKEKAIVGGEYKMLAIYCTDCRGIVSFTETMDNNQMLFVQNDLLNRIAAKLGIPDRLPTTV